MNQRNGINSVHTGCLCGRFNDDGSWRWEPAKLENREKSFPIVIISSQVWSVTPSRELRLPLIRSPTEMIISRCTQVIRSDVMQQPCAYSFREAGKRALRVKVGRSRGDISSRMGQVCGGVAEISSKCYNYRSEKFPSWKWRKLLIWSISRMCGVGFFFSREKVTFQLRSQHLAHMLWQCVRYTGWFVCWWWLRPEFSVDG